MSVNVASSLTPLPLARTVIGYAPGVTDGPTVIVNGTVVVFPLVVGIPTVPMTPPGTPRRVTVGDPRKDPPTVAVPINPVDSPCSTVTLVRPRVRLRVGSSSGSDGAFSQPGAKATASATLRP